MTLTLNNNTAAYETPADKMKARSEPSIRVWITLEVVLYGVLAVLALTLRLTQLGYAPLNDSEAYEALAALRAVNDQVSGEALISRSPITFVLDSITMTFMIPGNLAARLPIALGGVLLTLSPVLWRRYLNPLPPLIISLLLTLSPTTGLAARTLSPVIWSMLMAVIGPWLVLRFVETRAPQWAIAATAVFGAMILLAEPAGFLVVVGLAFGLMFAWLTEDDPNADIPGTVRELWRAWPWASGAFAAGLVILLVGTGFFWLPSSLTAIGNVVWTGLQGFVDRPEDTLIAFPLWVALRYEFGIFIFGLLGCYHAIRYGGFFERTVTGWFLAGLILSISYSGASAAHALWLTLPLTVLVGLMITRWLTERAEIGWPVPVWGVPVHAVITFALWMFVMMALIILGRVLVVDLPSSVTDLGALGNELTKKIYVRVTGGTDSVMIGEMPVFLYILGNIQKQMATVIAFLLINTVTFFLIGSLWGARAAWRGFALGTLIVLMLGGMGSGWRAAFNSWNDPRELWYPSPVTGDIDELKTTLREMSRRATGTDHLIDVVAQVPGDGAVAWALAGFPNVTFVSGAGPEVNAAAVIAPFMLPEPTYGADYIGRDLVIRERWDINGLSWRDALVWYYRSDSLYKPSSDEVVLLWVRKDVYGVERLTEE